MMKMFLIVIATILAVILGLTFIYVGFLFNENARRKVRIVIITLDLIMITSLIIGNIYRSIIPDTAIEIFGNIATVVFLSQFICMALVVVALIIRTICRLLNKPTPFNKERRRMLAYGMIYPALSLITALYGNQIERNDTVDNLFDIQVKDLPPELDGFRIAQISDVHIGAFFSLERLEKLLNRIVAAKPDILAITGDIFDNVPMNQEAIKLVDSFCDKFKYGIYYCHGNHEHHRGIQAIEAGLKQTKIHWLVNQSEMLPLSSKNPLYFVGVDYPMYSFVMPRSNDEDRQDMEKKFQQQKHEFLAKAMENVPDNAICILLAHHPEFIDDATEYNIPLTLTGHTHGSQVGIFGIPLFPVFKYTRGMITQDDHFGYVHVGNGSWFPFRIGCPPEIAYFTLKRRN